MPPDTINRLTSVAAYAHPRRFPFIGMNNEGLFDEG